MTVSKIEKSRILEAYFSKSITKQEMEALLIDGILLPPVPWIFPTEAEEIKDKQRRQLIERVFGILYTKIEWV
jgi:hypothetical protein